MKHTRVEIYEETRRHFYERTIYAHVCRYSMYLWVGMCALCRLLSVRKFVRMWHINLQLQGFRVCL